MPHRRPVIRSIADAQDRRETILASAARSATWLQEFEGQPLELLRALRFESVGHDPLTGNALNVVEQINQTFTILVCLRAVELLLDMHPEAEGYRLALGTSSGRDIESVSPNMVAAEAFSATHPGSNNKLKRDLQRMKSDSALHRYIFFAAPGYRCERQPSLESAPGVHVYSVEI